MPPELAQALADAHGLGVSIDERQATQLLQHVGLLQRWNATYNLTAVRDPDAMWRQHVLDCLAAVPPVRRTLAALASARASGSRARVLDVGSGGGLPGVVWAVVIPEVDLVCIDSVGKKAAFIRQAAGALGLPNLRAVHARVERWRDAPFDLVTSRAFASLRDFCDLTRHLLAPGGQWVAMKGRTPTDELQALGPGQQVFHVEPLVVPGLDAERCLVWMRPEQPSA